VTDLLNAGTYNFYNPTVKGVDEGLSKLLGNDTLHKTYDYNPYIDFGNAAKPQDPTSYQDRWSRKFQLPSTLIIRGTHE